MANTEQMSRSETQSTVPEDETVYRNYILDVRIVERRSPGDDVQYRFEAPHHEGRTFDDSEVAELYADVYFDVNGFEEAGTGDRGVPPTIIQAGRDTLVAYLFTQPHTDVYWLASFYGEKPEKIQRYINRVEKRAAKIRKGAREHGME